MKKLILFVTMLSFLALIITSCTKNEEKKIKSEMTPLDYHDVIFKEQVKIVNSILEFSKAFDNADEKIMEAKLERLNQQTSSSIEKLEDLEPYKGDNSLKENAIKLFEFYYSISDDEYEDMIEIQKKKEGITQEDYMKMNEMSRKIAEKESQLVNKLLMAEKSFAAKYGFTIEQYKFQNDNMGK